MGACLCNLGWFYMGANTLHHTLGQRNYFTIFFRTSRQFHIIISGINNGLFNASCDLEGI